MLNKYLLTLGIIDTLSKWNEELNKFASEHLDNVAVGTLIIGIIIFVSFIGIGSLNKKWKISLTWVFLFYP